MGRRLTALLGVVLALLACQKKNESPPSFSPKKTAVDLRALKSDGGCLSLERSVAEIRTLDQGLPVLLVSTQLEVSSEKPIREEFQRSLAYGNFLFEERPLSELTDFPPVRQQDCKTVTFLGPDGIDDEYEIVESTDEMLMLRNPDGRRLRYRWLSPESLEIETRFTAYDLPCADETPIAVDAVKVLAWSANRNASVGLQKNPVKIDPAFLARVGEAIGHSSTDLFSAAAPGEESALSPEKLIEFARAPPINDLKSCHLPVSDLTPP